MDAAGLASAVDRAERAIDRIERALETSRAGNGDDDQLRARVRDAVAELDNLIRDAEAPDG